MCNFVIAELEKEKEEEEKKANQRLCASVIPADTLSGILLNIPLSSHLFFRKAGYYKTVNIIGFTIPGTLVRGVRAETIIVRCNEVELCVFFQFESFALRAVITLTDNHSLKKKITINIHSLFFSGFEQFFNPTSYFTLHNRCGFGQQSSLLKHPVAF